VTISNVWESPSFSVGSVSVESGSLEFQTDSKEPSALETVLSDSLTPVSLVTVTWCGESYVSDSLNFWSARMAFSSPTTWTVLVRGASALRTG
jgi:hypothetical protein